MTQHVGTAVHAKLLRSGRNQSVFTSSSCGTLEVSHKKAVFTATEQQIFAEGLFAANHVCKVQSFNSVENVANLFRVMFPDSKIAEEFTQRTKLTYLVTHGLAKHFKTSLIGDIKQCSSGFSVMLATKGKSVSKDTLLIAQAKIAEGQRMREQAKMKQDDAMKKLKDLVS